MGSRRRRVGRPYRSSSWYVHSSLLHVLLPAVALAPRLSSFAFSLFSFVFLGPLGLNNARDCREQFPL